MKLQHFYLSVGCLDDMGPYLHAVAAEVFFQNSTQCRPLQSRILSENNPRIPCMRWDLLKERTDDGLLMCRKFPPGRQHLTDGRAPLRSNAAVTLHGRESPRLDRIGLPPQSTADLLHASLHGLIKCGSIGMLFWTVAIPELCTNATVRQRHVARFLVSCSHGACYFR